MMGCQSVADCKTAIKCNCVKNCPVTVKDIKTAEDVFGKDIHALKGKQVQKTPEPLAVDCIKVLPEILKIHKEVILFIDIMMINGLPFLVTTSKNLKFVTAEFITDKSIKNVHKCFKSVIKSHNS